MIVLVDFDERPVATRATERYSHIIHLVDLCIDMGDCCVAAEWAFPIWSRVSVNSPPFFSRGGKTRASHACIYIDVMQSAVATRVIIVGGGIVANHPFAVGPEAFLCHRFTPLPSRKDHAPYSRHSDSGNNQTYPDPIGVCAEEG